MPRNDGLLYSGMAANTRKLEEKKAARIEEKQKNREQLLPVADLILAEIEKLRQKNRARLVNLVNPETPDDCVKATLLGVRFTEEDLKTLKTQFEIILRRNESVKKA